MPGLGRVPDFLREQQIIRDLWNRKTDGSSDTLQQERMITIWPPQSSPPPGMIDGWMQYEFSHPCVLYPLIYPRASGGTSGKLLAHLGEKPAVPPDAPFMSRQSHNGMLWIPFPGKWWIVYDGPADSQKLPCMVIDDTCGMAQDVLGKRGVQISESTVSVLTASATTILPNNPFRDGVILQNQGTVDVWVRFATTADGAAAVGTGVVIPAGASLELVGETGYKGPLNGRADGANCNVRVLEIFS